MKKLILTAAAFGLVATNAFAAAKGGTERPEWTNAEAPAVKVEVRADQYLSTKDLVRARLGGDAIISVTNVGMDNPPVDRSGRN
ncbi:MAG: hypothetical protein Q4G49_09245 [Paracoccus sp. (in: a-proteobacteria)]|nr:hypothetical protein [Paracoccus sp. (in: a-proteobacteria)]